MIRRLSCATTLVLIGAGVPVLLTAVAGAPTLQGLPRLDRVRDALALRWLPSAWVIAALVLVAWALWAYLVLAVLLRVAGHIEARITREGRLWRASETVSWGPIKRLVDVAAGTMLLVSTVAAAPRPAPVRKAPGWAVALAPQVAAIRASPPPLSQVAAGEGGSRRAGTHGPSRSPGAEVAAGVRPGAPSLYTVRPGDSLWAIAEAKLSDPYRWTEIFELNRGRTMPDGRELQIPGFIRPGWTLRLPEPVSADEDSEREEGRCATPAPAPHDDSTPDSSSDPEGPSGGGNEPAPDDVDQPAGTQPVELPSGTSVALGFVSGYLCALGARELARRRRRRPRVPAPGWPSASGRRDLRGRLAQHDNTEALATAAVGTRGQFERGGGASPTVVLGHRDQGPVVASERGLIYSVTGPDHDVDRYLCDLALHALMCGQGLIEVWTTDNLPLHDVAGLSRHRDARALVSELEIEILKRHRLLDEEGLATWEAHEERWPDDPLSLVVALFSGSDESVAGRVAAVATQGLDLGLLLVARGLDGDGIHLEGDLARPVGPAVTLLGKQPFRPIRLADDDRAEVIRVLSRRTEEGDDAAPELAQSAPAARKTASAPVVVRLFGPPEIEGVSEDPGDGFGPKSQELLFFFLLHPHGASRDQAIEALWPETDPDQGVQRFWFQLRTVRRHLRTEAAPTAKFVSRSGELYRPVAALFDVDVWEFDRAVTAARKEDDATSQLERAVALYRGDLLDGTYYDWVEPIRAGLRDKFLDVLVRLSDLYQRDGNDEPALKASLRAIAVDPYAEHLYRRIMELYGRMGRASDIRRVYAELEAALAEGLQAEPDHDTAALKDLLLDRLARGTAQAREPGG